MYPKLAPSWPRDRLQKGQQTSIKKGTYVGIPLGTLLGLDFGLILDRFGFGSDFGINLECFSCVLTLLCLCFLLSFHCFFNWFSIAFHRFLFIVSKIDENSISRAFYTLYHVFKFLLNRTRFLFPCNTGFSLRFPSYRERWGVLRGRTCQSKINMLQKNDWGQDDSVVSGDIEDQGEFD